eukprot:NODE_18262_length_902_cov_1.531613.p3 GENE.NODE_18262_length_902_cov_1.531613~~NODE_18262_length_902_cov_1.531613.p3  ORF type:complete len:62 (-),score=2.87 NODE_18262_length_902_cov_1.531613:332-517(-)
MPSAALLAYIDIPSLEYFVPAVLYRVLRYLPRHQAMLSWAISSLAYTEQPSAATVSVLAAA